MAGRNMEITVAKTAGFCFGVKRAVEKVYDQIATWKKQIYTYGPIIHNEEVVQDLEEKGVQVINSKEELERPERRLSIIRSHGVGKHIYDLLERHGVYCGGRHLSFCQKDPQDCPEQQAAGRRVIIVGNPDHPEVRGSGDGEMRTLWWSKTGANRESCRSRPDEKLCVVAQTTFNYNKFQDLVEKFEKKGYDILVLNTICNATQERQVEARRIASEVDAMIVIGGRNSSNTQKLYEICRKECKNTYFIQTLAISTLNV